MAIPSDQKLYNKTKKNSTKNILNIALIEGEC